MCMVHQLCSEELTFAEILTGSKWQRTPIRELRKVCLVLSHLVYLMTIQMPLATFGMSVANKARPVSGVTYVECGNAHVPIYVYASYGCRLPT